MGEFDIALEDIFKNGQAAQDVSLWYDFHRSANAHKLEAPVVLAPIQKVRQKEERHLWRSTAQVLHHGSRTRHIYTTTDFAKVLQYSGAGTVTRGWRP